MPKDVRAAKRKSIEHVRLSPDDRVELYARSSGLAKSLKQKCGLLLPFTTYFQDPFVAKSDPTRAFDDDVLVHWEPGFAHGPTSSRFAIVDYNADTGVLQPPAVWSEELQTFVGVNGKRLDASAAATFQFHQVSVWALLQCALSFFEDASALGRSIPWAFEGNRLIVVPHAGFGENAFYDRASKSLQFYYFGNADATVYTCLSTDIVNHEMAHAVLDGIRPLYNETSSPQTGAFHEFVGDLTAILLTLRNTKLRRRLANASRGAFRKATALSSLAEEFGQAVKGRPYLRSADNPHTMASMAEETEPHNLSEVLTGAMFEVLVELGKSWQKHDRGRRKKTPLEVFYLAADRMQRMAIQPLDLLPPVEVTFRDYAMAVCRAQRLADPIDPEDYYGILIKVFRKRGILSLDDAKELREPKYVTERFDLRVPHDIDTLSRSRAAAYRFLDDNREVLLIPASRDFFVADLYDAHKRGRQNLPQPRQIILEYAWREEVALTGARFGPFADRQTTMLCGGTIVFNEEGNILSWMMKPGSEAYMDVHRRSGRIAQLWNDGVAEGRARRDALLDNIAAQMAAGRVSAPIGSPKGLLGSMMAPMSVEDDGAFVKFQLSPHLDLSEHTAPEPTGARQWQISC